MQKELSLYVINFKLKINESAKDERIKRGGCFNQNSHDVFIE
ncbi:hypothetical protein J520_3039 [Acinetobacter sp. 869535]|nr:hypothetical protein J520_3039 [Acinetobacter sp. 869535]